jgi:hypothetical protein
MNRAISSSSPSSAEPVGARRRSLRVPSSRMAHSRLIGALFLSAILFYGVGDALVTSVVGTPASLSRLSAHQATLNLGALLMLVNSVVVVALGVLFFPILKKHDRRTAVAYLASRVVEAVLLAVGVLCLAVILPLAQHSVDGGSLAIRSNTVTYQIAMMSLGLGSVFLCSVLFRTRLIPRFLSVWGLVGYGILLAGATAETFGIHIGVILSIPGGLFELVLGFRLLIKGFQPAAFSGGVARRLNLSRDAA